MDCIVDRVSQLINIDSRQRVPHHGWDNWINSLSNFSSGKKKKKTQKVLKMIYQDWILDTTNLRATIS